MNTLNRFAVIGRPIAHSLSPQIHQHFANQTGKALVYEKIETDSSQFKDVVLNFFANQGLGLNITLPFKEAAFELAAYKTPRALLAKAANTLWMRDGYLCADNTDGVGLIRDLSKRVALSNASVLILGAGGATRGIIGALFDAGVLHVYVYNRSPGRLLRLHEDFPEIERVETLDDVSAFDIIINATSIRDMDWPLHFGRAKQFTFCYDLSYKLEADTSFVAWTKQQGMPACDGLGMLIAQAAESFYIWHGVKVLDDVLNSCVKDRECNN